MVTDARPETIDQRELRRAGEYFKKNVEEHEMTVLLDTLDDGTPYRHVRFAKPGTSIWSWSLITWPGHLAISGDLQDHVFSRLYDMFAFFGRGSIDPRYWGEKLVAEGQRTQYGRTRFSQEKYNVEVIQHADWAQYGLCSKCWPKFMAQVEEDLLAQTPNTIEEALYALEDFTWRPEGCLACHEVQFQDPWEWDMSGWDWHFLIALHAVQHGVKSYLQVHPDRLVPEAR